MKDARTRQIAAIHAAKRALGLDDDAYRDMLRAAAGVSSSKDLDEAGRRRVLDHLRSKGFKRKGGKPSEDRQTRMIYGLWGELGDMGVLRDPSRKGLSAFCERQTGKSLPEFMDRAQLNTMVETLWSWIDRERGARGLPPKERSDGRP